MAFLFSPKAYFELYWRRHLWRVSSSQFQRKFNTRAEVTESDKHTKLTTLQNQVDKSTIFQRRYLEHAAYILWHYFIYVWCYLIKKNASII
jgi:hypothetical protein